LRFETKGYRVVTIGSSAGGYAAVLLGCLLNASLVFAFSCQFSLEHLLKDEKSRNLNPLIVKYSGESSCNKFYNLTELINKSRVPIFYFMPTESGQDADQYNLVRSIPNVFTCKIIDNVHGIPLYDFSLSETINFSLIKMKNIYKLVSHTNGISKYRYALISSGFYKTNTVIIKNYFIYNTLRAYFIFRRICKKLGYCNRPE